MQWDQTSCRSVRRTCEGHVRRGVRNPLSNSNHPKVKPWVDVLVQVEIGRAGGVDFMAE